jgi:acetyl-CoA C-acetyltransferase
MHAIAETVRRLRSEPKALGLVGANGGYLSKYAVGVYSATPAPWRPFENAAEQAAIDAAKAVPLADPHSGLGRLESYTIDYAEAQPKALVVGRTAAGERFVAGSTAPQIVEMMIEHDPLGSTVETVADEGGRNLIVGLDREERDGRADQRRTAG